MIGYRKAVGFVADLQQQIPDIFRQILKFQRVFRIRRENFTCAPGDPRLRRAATLELSQADRGHVQAADSL